MCDLFGSGVEGHPKNAKRVKTSHNTCETGFVPPTNQDPGKFLPEGFKGRTDQHWKMPTAEDTRETEATEVKTGSGRGGSLMVRSGDNRELGDLHV